MNMKLKEICAPFFSQTGITYYNLVKIFNDGSRVTLCTNSKWESYFHKQNKNLINLETTLDGAHGKVVWDCLSRMRDNKLIKDARELFDIDHGCTIIDNYDDCVEYHYFASTRDNEDINLFYINNDADIRRFIMYFKRVAAPLIEKSKLYHFNNDTFWKNQNREGIFQNKMKRIYLEGDYKEHYLTEKQAKVFKGCIEGKTAKQIAKEQGVSSRTVEKHVANIKIKFNCLKSAFPSVAKKSGFLRIAQVV